MVLSVARDTRPGNLQMGSSACAAGAKAHRASGTQGHGAAASEARPMNGDARQSTSKRAAACTDCVSCSLANRSRSALPLYLVLMLPHLRFGRHEERKALKTTQTSGVAVAGTPHWLLLPRAHILMDATTMPYFLSASYPPPPRHEHARAVCSCMAGTAGANGFGLSGSVSSL